MLKPSPPCPKRALFSATLLAGVVVVSSTGLAQVTIDVSKITCEQYLTFKVANPQDISIWLSGYFHGRKGDSVIETQLLKENFELLKNACFLRENLRRPVLDVAEEKFAQKR